MADTVKKSNEAERELERRVMHYQVEKEQKDALLDDRKKEEARRKLIEIKKTLDTQVQERRLQKDHEHFVNEVYMQKWMQMAEEDNSKRKQKEELGKKKRLDVKDFLLMQMHSGSLTTSLSAAKPEQSEAGGITESAKKAVVGKAMNVEELRINK